MEKKGLSTWSAECIERSGYGERSRITHHDMMRRSIWLFSGYCALLTGMALAWIGKH